MTSFPQDAWLLGRNKPIHQRIRNVTHLEIPDRPCDRLSVKDVRSPDPPERKLRKIAPSKDEAMDKPGRFSIVPSYQPFPNSVIVGVCYVSKEDALIAR